MASTSEQRAVWEEQAAFMKAVGAAHAEWADYVDQGGRRQILTKLVLFPSASAPAARSTAQPAGGGPAARLLKMHQTQFAATSMKPPPPAAAAADVPRADRATRARGTKNPK